MLIEALVSCAGVTLAAVSTAMGIELRHARVHAQGDIDFLGTLGVSEEIAVGFSAIRLGFDLDTDADDEAVEKLVELTERSCVVLQTIRKRYAGREPASQAVLISRRGNGGSRSAARWHRWARGGAWFTRRRGSGIVKYTVRRSLKRRVSESWMKTRGLTHYPTT